MTWRRAFAYVGVWLALSAYYFARRGVLPAEEPHVAVAAPTPVSEPAPKASYLRAEPEQVVEVEVSAGERKVRAVRDGGRWRIAEPPNAVVSADLVTALIDAVLGASPVQVVSVDSNRDAEFGLDAPAARVRFKTGEDTGVDLVLGKENPAQTGVYGRAAGSPEIVLVGLNARYYVDLILRAAG